MSGKKSRNQTKKSESQSGQLGQTASSTPTNPSAPGAAPRPSQPRPADSQPTSVPSTASTTGPPGHAGSQTQPTSGQRRSSLNPTARPFQPAARSTPAAPPSLARLPPVPASSWFPPQGTRSRVQGCWPLRPEPQQTSSAQAAPPALSQAPHPGQGVCVQGAWPPRQDQRTASSAKTDFRRQPSPSKPQTSKNGQARSPRHENPPPAPRHFMPSRAALASGEEETAENAALRKEMSEAMGFSENYQGNPYAPRNQDPDIPEEENCSFWITKLPTSTTVHTLLGSIRGAGRVYATHINEPMLIHGRMYRAAKLSFFELQAARRFWASCQQHGKRGNYRMRVGRYWVQVQYNRHLSAEVTVPHATRCIMVQGPESWVRLDNLQQFFDARFMYQIDDLRVVDEVNGYRTIEVRFGSWRSQAESAMQAVLMDSPENVVAWYVRDPCDV